MTAEAVPERGESHAQAGITANAPLIVGGFAFLWLFWQPISSLGYDWWNNPEAGHGLLLGPLSLYLAFKSGLVPEPKRSPRLGLLILGGAVVLRVLSGVAAEFFTMRLSLLGAALGLIVFTWGFAQVRRWWLPSILLFLSIPLPAVLLTTLAFPLQLQASELGASLLEWRSVPVALQGNVIHLPGQTLFVTEACSGLRSLTALVSLGVLMGGMWLKHPVARTLLLLVTVPVAMLINGVRVFLTGFLVFFVDPALGEGFMHMTEGWAMATAPRPARSRRRARGSRGGGCMSGQIMKWAPVALMVMGGLLLTFVQTQELMELRKPLASALPADIGELPGTDTAIQDWEVEVAGVSDYALRLYGSETDTTKVDGVRWASIYLGYYDHQTQGKSIHSPKNCLPGAGWEALTSGPETLASGADAFTVNRYVLQNGDARALVLYWYQGRGRVAHDEYLVKWDLLRDAATMRRTEETLVRIVVAIDESEEASFDFARRVAEDLKPALDLALPL
jgi:EpsI family protein